MVVAVGGAAKMDDDMYVRTVVDAVGVMGEGVVDRPQSRMSVSMSLTNLHGVVEPMRMLALGLE